MVFVRSRFNSLLSFRFTMILAYISQCAFAEPALAVARSAPCYRGTEDVLIEAVVVAELKLGAESP